MLLPLGFNAVLIEQYGAGQRSAASYQSWDIADLAHQGKQPF